MATAGIGVATLLGVAVTAGPAASAAPDPALAQFYGQQPAWSACEGDLAELDCATLVVPLDYANPGAEQIAVTVSRKKASDQEHRRGVLLSNPGGPGGSGLVMPKYLAAKTELGKVYDLVGFDPRGVGKSTALNCETRPALATEDSRPPDADFPQWVAEARQAEEGCNRAAGGIRPFVNTPNTARDLDVIRGVLGEPKINYLGYSYGTYLGAVYGSLFPQNLDRSVLDSSVHPEWVWREQFKAQAIAYRKDVEAWSAWVAERNGTFKLGSSAGEVLAGVEKVSSALFVKPVGDYTRTSFDGAMGVGARYRPLWSDLALIVGKLRDGAAPPAANPTPAPVSRAEVDDAARAGTLLAGLGLANLHSGVFDTVTCEADWPTDLGVYYEEMRVFRDRYPYGYGVVRAAPTTCAFRSFTPPEPLVKIKRDGYPVGLVIQAEGDAQTQYDSGPAMSTRLRDNLISVADDGTHGQYGGHNDCVNAQVNHYLLDGVLPASSSSCKGDPRPNVAADPAPASPVQPSAGATLEQSVRAFIDNSGLATRPF
ncbi:alpha/beta fold hydrolase [Solihabitans fulvus]|uniref:alpha/beta fold hydrolase n=1 Tax=Solihabitans fulvus TaxID=1892852 RepID=UPI001CB764FA|nr:alpha/beta fold hydrolase [Solihabitans fulvus]